MDRVYLCLSSVYCGYSYAVTPQFLLYSDISIEYLCCIVPKLRDHRNIFAGFPCTYGHPHWHKLSVTGKIQTCYSGRRCRRYGDLGRFDFAELRYGWRAARRFWLPTALRSACSSAGGVWGFPVVLHWQRSLGGASIEGEHRETSLRFGGLHHRKPSDCAGRGEAVWNQQKHRT